MKKIILTLTLQLFCSTIFGQTFTISELIKINNYGIDDFDTYVTQKGYKYYENSNTDFANTTSYTLYINGVRKSYISKVFYKNKNTEMVSYQTGDNNTYLKIKSELKTLGFKFIDTETNDGTTFFNYKKDNIEISLASFVQVTDYGDKKNSYEISISKY